LLPNGKINFELFRLFGERLEFVRQFQQIPYSLSAEPKIVQFMNELYFIDDDDLLYSLSLKAQPNHMDSSLTGGTDEEFSLEGSKSSGSFSETASNTPNTTATNSSYTSDSSEMEVDADMEDNENLEETMDNSNPSDSNHNENEEDNETDHENGTGHRTVQTNECSMVSGQRTKSPDEINVKTFQTRSLLPSSPSSQRLLRKSISTDPLALSLAAITPTTPITTTITNSNAKKKRNLRRSTSKKRLQEEVRCRTVQVPIEMASLFRSTERMMDQYFGQCRQSLEKGTIFINEERYILLKASSLNSKEFLKAFVSSSSLLSSYPSFHREIAENAVVADNNNNNNEREEQQRREFVNNFLFDLSHSIGKVDARYFKSKTELSKQSMLAQLSVSAVHLSYCGWGLMAIHADSNLSNNAEFKLHFDLLHSFEADSLLPLESNTNTQFPPSKYPMCILSCGYLSGFCEEVLGMPITCLEIFCRAKGDSTCTFLMGNLERIDDLVCNYIAQLKLSDEKSQCISVPSYLETRKERKYIQLEESSIGRSSSLSSASVSKRKGTISSSSSLESSQKVVNILYHGNQEQLVAEKKLVKQSHRIFKEITSDPEHAMVAFVDQRYIFIRSKSIASEFFHVLSQAFGSGEEVSEELLFFKERTRKEPSGSVLVNYVYLRVTYVKSTFQRTRNGPANLQ